MVFAGQPRVPPACHSSLPYVDAPFSDKLRSMTFEIGRGVAQADTAVGAGVRTAKLPILARLPRLG